MARIETYVKDGNITINDFVLGSDGDNLNATKNYSLLNMLNFLGTNYNLQSMDLVYTYNNVDSGSVEDGQLSTNNYSDDPIAAADITNIYPSKVTAFGQLVEEYLETVGAAGLTITLVDLANYNNFAIMQIDSVSDVDANTLDLEVTVGTSNGSFSAGRSVGIKVDPAGATVDLSNYVTLDGIQTITGSKTFSTFTTFQQNITLRSALVQDYIAIQNSTYNPASSSFTYGSLFFEDGIPTFVKPDVGTSQRRLTFDWNSTVPRKATFQDADGVVAYLSDITDYDVETTSVGYSLTWLNQDGTANATPTVPVSTDIEITKVGKVVRYTITIFARLGAQTAPITVKGRVQITWDSVPYTYNTSYNETITADTAHLTGGATNTIGFISAATQFIGGNLTTIAEYSMDLISNHTSTSGTNIRIKGSYVTT